MIKILDVVEKKVKKEDIDEGKFLDIELDTLTYENFRLHVYVVDELERVTDISIIQQYTDQANKLIKNIANGKDSPATVTALRVSTGESIRAALGRISNSPILSDYFKNEITSDDSSGETIIVRTSTEYSIPGRESGKIADLGYDVPKSFEVIEAAKRLLVSHVKIQKSYDKILNSQRSIAGKVRTLGISELSAKYLGGHLHLIIQLTQNMLNDRLRLINAIGESATKLGLALNSAKK